jgi:hypothetical protein
MPRRSPLTTVTPALSIATSVPVPIAMPTSAAASAGASLIPSPAIATTRPSARRRSTTSCFCAGMTSASKASSLELRGHRLRGAAAVARQHDHANAFVAQRLERFLRGGLDRIGDAQESRWPAVDGDEEDRLSFGAQGLRAVSQRGGIGAHFGKKRGAAHHDRAAVHRSGDALSGDAAEVGGGRERCTALLARLVSRRPRIVRPASIRSTSGSKACFRRW